MTNYYTIKPAENLSEYVRFFWVLECDLVPNEHFVYRSMADGCTELLFHYNGLFDEVRENGIFGKSFHSGIHGQTRTFRRFKINKGFGIFGVYLYPYAIPSLLNISASDVSDEMPDLQSVFGKEGTELEEKVMIAANNQERVLILSSFLLSKLKKSKNAFNHIYNSIKTVIQHNGQINVTHLANDYCLSTRQFERRFKEFSGFTPKLYSRIIRFQSIFNELNSDKANLSQIACRCGYYDQSHFIQDFKEFSGYNPKELLSGRSSDTTIWNE